MEGGQGVACSVADQGPLAPPPPPCSQVAPVETYQATLSPPALTNTFRLDGLRSARPAQAARVRTVIRVARSGSGPMLCRPCVTAVPAVCGGHDVPAVTALKALCGAGLWGVMA